METYFHCFLGTHSLNSSLLGYFISVLSITVNWLVMIWVLSTKSTTMPRFARLIREVGLRRFLHCYAVAGILLFNMMISHIAVLCSRSNDQTTLEAIAITRSTPTWWLTLQDAHQMGVW